MHFSEVAISEEALQQACKRSYREEGVVAFIFAQMKDGRRVEGVVATIRPRSFIIVSLQTEEYGRAKRQALHYKDISRWAILTKLEIARDWQRLAESIEYIGGQVY